MCGLTGFLRPSADRNAQDLRCLVARMAGTLRHRGPDDEGTFVEESAGFALGFRRLAIIDLTPAGRQPMESASGRFLMAFNGEFYNFRALGRELQSLGWKFRGHSDTEVVLAAIEQWGIAQALERVNGMFAVALWDRRERTLHLIRDRMGEKPMYWGFAGKSFVFGSELKALRAHPEFSATIDRGALALYLRHNCVPAPFSIYRNVWKMPPATILSVRAGQDWSRLSPVPYWSVKDAAERGLAEPFRGTDAEAVSCFEELLQDAVRLRMEADVPLGAFLSGGVDSSTVVALMQAQSPRPVRTFTIGFREASYDEAQDARNVAHHLGTDHTQLYVTSEEAREVIPLLPKLYDEPFADSSQIPTYLVSRLARRQVTVSLSGDGGDELFAGYNRYSWGRKIWKGLGWMPSPLRAAAAKGLLAVSPGAWDRLFRRLGRVFPQMARQRMTGEKIHKLAGVLGADGPEALYLGLVSHWTRPETIVSGAREPATIVTDSARWASLPDFTLRMMFLDAVTYLPDDILVKLDRATMGVSLEGRVPLLDHRLVEFSWRVPLSMKIRHGEGKWLLRQVLHRYVPPSLVERPKMGFGVPIDSWLRGPLRDWAETLLGENRLRREGFLNPAPIREKWVEHLSGRRNWQHHLWDILMFQAWLEEGPKAS